MLNAQLHRVAQAIGPNVLPASSCHWNPFLKYVSKQKRSLLLLMIKLRGYTEQNQSEES
jgi:hypothetical protein